MHFGPPPPPTSHHLRGVRNECFLKTTPKHLSAPHASGPPPPPPLKPLTTSGGSEITTFAHFRVFNQSFFEGISGQMEMNFKKPKEVFVHNGTKNKKISHFLHRYHEKGESKPSSSPIFPVFHFSVTVLILRELFR
jgi:hypothetical protein